MADTESQNKLNAALRYAGTSAATMFTIFGVLQFVTPDQVAQLTQAVHEFNQSILSAYGALTKMWVILGPAALVVLGRIGVKSSSVQAIGAKLLRMAASEPPPPSTDPFDPRNLESIAPQPKPTSVAAAQATISKATSATEVLAAVVAAAPAAIAAKGT